MEELDATSGTSPNPPFVITVNNAPTPAGSGIVPGNALVVSPDDVISITPDSVNEPFIVLDMLFVIEGATEVTVTLVGEDGLPVPGYPPQTVSSKCHFDFLILFIRK